MFLVQQDQQTLGRPPPEVSWSQTDSGPGLTQEQRSDASSRPTVVRFLSQRGCLRSSPQQAFSVWLKLHSTRRSLLCLQKSSLWPLGCYFSCWFVLQCCQTETNLLHLWPLWWVSLTVVLNLWVKPLTQVMFRLVAGFALRPFTKCCLAEAVTNGNLSRKSLMRNFLQILVSLISDFRTFWSNYFSSLSFLHLSWILSCVVSLA